MNEELMTEQDLLDFGIQETLNMLVKKGYETTLEEVIKDVIRRDEIDSNREFAPLVKADDAIEIDTTGKSIEGVVEDVISKIK